MFSNTPTSNTNAVVLPPKIDDEYPLWVSLCGSTDIEKTHQIRINSNISCLQYVISGSGIVNSDDRSFIVNQGDTFLLKEGTNQNYSSIPGIDFKRIWINFSGILANDLFSIYNIDNVVFKNLNTMPLIEEMHRICRSSDDVKEIKKAMAVQFLKIVQFLSENHTNVSENAENFDFVRNYIDSHITENIKLSDISEISHFTPEHIVRKFKKMYGITPHQYIINSKIEIASVLLRTTQKSIAQISAELSFSDPHHFSALFEKKKGIRPLKFRKLHRST